MIETEYLIVGGGPAGSIVAKYLSQANIDNIVVQRKLDYKKPCGGGIRLDAFSEFEIDKKLIKKYVDNIAMVYKDARVEIDISKYQIGIVDRVEFDQKLRLDAQKLGTVLYEATFLSLELYDDYVISKIKKDGQYIEVKSKYIIASDGANSKIRKLVNGDEVRGEIAMHTDILSKKYNMCEFHFGESIAAKHYAWAFPHWEGSNIGTVAGSDKSYMQNFVSTLKIDEKIGIKGFKIPQFKNNIFYKNRVFFVGDSAGQVLPFTYEGIYYAMSSAKILAKVIVDKADVSEYEKRWNTKYLKKFTTILRLQNIFLRNNFMISIMMRLYKKSYFQKSVIEFWLGKREVKLDFAFFIRTLKKIF